MRALREFRELNHFMVFVVLCVIVMLGFAGIEVLQAADKPKDDCHDNLVVASGLAREYSEKMGNALQEKVVYKVNFEQERAKRVALEKELEELKAKLSKEKP